MNWIHVAGLVALGAGVAGTTEAATAMLISDEECHKEAEGTEVVGGPDELVACQEEVECDDENDTCDRRNKTFGGAVYYWCSCSASVPASRAHIGCTVITIDDPPAERLTKCNDAAVCGVALGCKKVAAGNPFKCKCK